MRHFLLATIATTTAAVAAPPPRPAPVYAVTDRIAGPDGGWDYAQVDPAADRLFVAHGDVVTTVSLGKPRVVGSIGPVVHAHGVVPIPDRGLLMVTSGKDDSVRLFDIATGRETAKIAVGGNPDAAFYDARRHLGVVMNARSGTVSVIDVATAKVARTITLKPGLEFGALGPDDLLLVNNEEANEIQVANLVTGTVQAPIALTGCDGPSGLGIDRVANRLIAACGNGKAAIVDIARRRLAALVDIGGGPDAVIVDEQRRLAFIPCGRDGTLEILALGDRTHPVTRSGAIRTEVGARTGALDPRDGTVYLPSATLMPPPGGKGRPVAQPGTFHILVVTRG